MDEFELEIDEDEFELEIDESETDDREDLPDLQDRRGRSMLIANRDLPHTGVMHLHRCPHAQ